MQDILQLPVDPRCEYLTTKQTADHLNISIQQLELWRMKGGGPRYLKLAQRLVRYRLVDIDQWANGQSKSHTSQPD